MTRKTLKYVLSIVAVLLVALTAGVVVASTKTKTELPEYLGSTSCLGCHADKFENWSGSLHATFTQEVKSLSELPGDISTLPADLRAELEKVDVIFHGGRLMRQDLVTGEYKYLGVQYDPATETYKAYDRKDVSMDATCGGCHAGQRDPQTGLHVEAGVGCESCHGPGKEHILGRGDVSKIWNSADPTKSCASCHSGYNQAPNSSRFPVGYRPGMTLEEVGFVANTFKADAAPVAMHHKGAVPQWEASGHATALTTLVGSGHAQDRCFECHSSDFQTAEETGKTFVAKEATAAVTCVSCHDPHGSNVPGQLRKDAGDLCASCHTAEIAEGTTFKPGAAVHHPQKEMLAGYGAIGVTNTTGAHTELTCVECHMTGANHQMKVLKPSDVIGTTTKDTCTTCHSNSSAESRDVYLTMWQEGTETKVTALKADIAAIDAALKANANALTAQLKATYDAAKTNVSMVEADASKGAHNFEYTMKILAQAKKDIATAKAGLK
jgi:predicted CXXCH cytochrome family protein